jgi:hypothetical protein
MTAINDSIKALGVLTQGMPIGTNLGLARFLWMLMSGALQPQRGAIFPALTSIGLTEQETRRTWAAFRGGVWQMKEMVGHWQAYARGLPGWREHSYEGYKPIAVDVTAFWRPALEGCPSKHYHPAAGRALPAVIMGIVGQVGEIGGQRLAVPLAIERVHPKDPSEKRLWQEMLKQVKKHQAADEIIVVDAGVKVRDLQKAEIENYEVRLAKNFTARRNYLPEYKKRGRKPTYGEIVRPLKRTRKDKTIDATAPDEAFTAQEGDKTLRIEMWHDLVLPDSKPDKNNKTFDVYVIHDPDFDEPWELATPVKLQALSVRAIYRDRWPVEQIPLSAKHMVGAHRQFVHAKESIQRLPELALLAGSVLSFLAATLPATPTGFWDRQPKRTPGRLRRVLMGKPFPEVDLLPEQLRKKNSVTDHLLKGNLARQHYQAVSIPIYPA